MKKTVVLLTIMAFYCLKTEAQSDIDALRYSYTSPLGSTAKSMSLGGAIGAVGADPGAVLSNPAGLAQYKTNIFNLSVGSMSSKNKSTYLGNTSSASNIFKPNLPSANLVSTNRRMERGNPTKKGWVNTNFLIGWNKTADFNRTLTYKGENTNSSFTDYVADYVGGLPSSELASNQEQLDRGFYYFENMFWDAYLIDTINDGSYFGNYDNLAVNQYQQGQIITKGGMNEVNLALASNYEHKVYVGVGLNINSVRYEESNILKEEDNPLTTSNYNSFEFTRNLSTSGIGVSGRIGLIFRPNNNIRIGGTIHTPKALRLTDSYFEELYVLNDDGTNSDLRTIDKEYTYTVTTPMKYAVQATYLFGKQGFLSAELESIDYSTMNITADDNAFISVNDRITTDYISTVNLKIGGEYVLDALRLRGGFASMGNPLGTSEMSRNMITGGVGVNDKNWSFDLGVVKHLNSDTYIPYSAPGFSTNTVSNNLNGTQLVLSLSTKF